MRPRVSIVKGNNRRDNVRKAIELIADDVVQSVAGKRIVVKPNFVSSSNQLASSHVDQVRGILDFFKESGHRKDIFIAEAASGDTGKAFEHYGYELLIREYGVKLIDLNQGEYSIIPIRDYHGNRIDVRVSRLLFDKDIYLVSATRLKTHDVVVVTLVIKNIVMGSLLMPDKISVLQGIPQTNRNIAALGKYVWPDLAVIDGLEGMEGDGPSKGDPKHVGVAIAGRDALAVDRVCCEVMGVEFKKVGYLYYCQEMKLGEGELKNIELIGEHLVNCITPFRLHRDVKKQYDW